MKVLLIGPPGSGKGTQAALLAKKLRIPHISTGDMIREEIKNNTELGNKVDQLVKKGELIPDKTIFELLKNRIEKPDCEKGFILDGFPRTIEQAKMLEDIEIDKAIYIDLPDEVAVHRISSRRQCTGCGAIYGKDAQPQNPEKCDKCGAALFQREDEKEETVKNRLSVYHEQTDPLIAFYSQKGVLVKVNGNQLIKNVEQEINSKLNLD